MINFFISLQILSRQFNFSVTWVIELSTLLVIYMVYLLVGRSSFENSHLKVDFFLNRFSEKNKRFVNLFINTLNIFTCVVVLISVTIYIYQMKTFNSAQLRIPLPYYFYPVFVGFVIMLIAYCRNFYLGIKEFSKT
ncbi:TRAP transporter small permease [Salipaludibacillus sp. CF4.18]|uniref:TRAP transporter small permease n=1 Tax=Salipaludibacillus sp. CF4.18 TaxID=3373081 RepID=UPI003EE7AA3A